MAAFTLLFLYLPLPFPLLYDRIPTDGRAEDEAKENAEIRGENAI